jgi:hypothetical protein
MRDPLTARELLIIGIGTGAALVTFVFWLYGVMYLSGAASCSI